MAAKSMNAPKKTRFDPNLDISSEAMSEVNITSDEVSEGVSSVSGYLGCDEVVPSVDDESGESPEDTKEQTGELTPPLETVPKSTDDQESDNCPEESTVVAQPFPAMQHQAGSGHSGGTDDQQRCAAVCTLVGAPDGRGSTNHSASADVPQSSQPPDGMQIVQTKDLVSNPFPPPLPAAYYYGDKKDLLDYRNRDRDYLVPSSRIAGMYAFVPSGLQTSTSGLCFCPGCCGEDGDDGQHDWSDDKNVDLMFDR